MEDKYNYATPQRPDGTRPLDGNIIPIDIPKYIHQLIAEEAYKKNGKNAITVFKSDQVTITIVALAQGEMMHPGNEEGFGTMSLQLFEGQIYFESFDREIELNKGSILALHQKLSFKAKALLDTICLLTMVK